MARRYRLVTGAVVLALVVVACGRSGSSKETGSDNTTATTATAQNGNAHLSAGSFGNLTKVCQKGDAKGATDTGVTDTEIHVGTFSDKGSSFRPGLTKEMYDSAVAFTKWCNDHGGILGRKLVLADRDSKLFEYPARIIDACQSDFALVGGGAVFDDADKGGRVKCGLANIAGYVVTPDARVAKLQVQPVPNPVYKLPVGAYVAAKRRFPDAVKKMAFLTGNLPAVLIVGTAKEEGVKQIGYGVVANTPYNPAGEQDWRPFAEKLKSSGARALEMIGEPENLTALQKAMDTIGYTPDVVIQEANFYDQKYIKEGGRFAKNTYVRTIFYPFELAKDNPPTQDYLDMMKQYNPGGKIAALGVQGVSAWLLFAKAATECASNLTRSCLIEKAQAVTSWTGGGLHGVTNPSKNTPSPCVAMLRATPAAWVYDKAMTKPDKGIFNCDPANIVELKNDYGVPRT